MDNFINKIKEDFKEYKIIDCRGKEWSSTSKLIDACKNRKDIIVLYDRISSNNKECLGISHEGRYVSCFNSYSKIALKKFLGGDPYECKICFAEDYEPKARTAIRCCGTHVCIDCLVKTQNNHCPFCRTQLFTL
jgi:hypothetical protein